MIKTDRIPMKLSDRAKIFMPFAALKGYEEALAKQEQLAIERMKEQRVHGE